MFSAHNHFEELDIQEAYILRLVSAPLRSTSYLSVTFRLIFHGSNDLIACLHFMSEVQNKIL